MYAKFEVFKKCTNRATTVGFTETQKLICHSTLVWAVLEVTQLPVFERGNAKTARIFE